MKFEMTEINNLVEQYRGEQIPSMDNIHFSVDRGTFGFDDHFSCLSDDKQKISGEYFDVHVLFAFYANVGDGADEMMETLRS